MTSFDISQEESALSRRSDALGLLGEITGLADPRDITQQRGFSLRLGDGSRWWINSAPHAASLTDNMATIMQLQEGDPSADGLLFFYEKDADHIVVDWSRLQTQGWINLSVFFFRICFHPRFHHFIAEYDSKNPGSSPYGMICEALPAVYWESISRGGLPFHAALLEYQGQAVILAAAGETGKSTCSRRVPPPWRALCDDEILTVLSPEGRYLAHPFPTWTDYLWERAPNNTWKVEAAVPLAGIFFFEQAPEDDCVPLEGAAAAVAASISAGQVMARFIRWCGAEETREIRQAMFASACEIVKQIPTFRLRVSLTGSFWEKVKAALGWR